MARSSARLNTLWSKGTRIGTRERTFRSNPPDSISTPLAFCAFRMRSVSSNKSGMKRMASMMSRAISSTGTLRYLSGFIYHSMAQTISRGEVVSVMSVESQIAEMSWNPTFPPFSRPCRVA